MATRRAIRQAIRAASASISRNIAATPWWFCCPTVAPLPAAGKHLERRSATVKPPSRRHSSSLR
jgi:hypothetical protein